MTVDVQLARDQFVSTQSAFTLEWLVTNGLGGFASGTIAQANTRRYHGLLVAALKPPGCRVLTLSKLGVALEYRGRRYELDSNEFADGTLAPRGFERLCHFGLEHGLPLWRYALEDALLEQRIWMLHERNVTCIEFAMVRAAERVQLELLPLCTYRDYHSHTRGGWSLEVAAEPDACRILAFAGAVPYRLSLAGGRFTYDPDWYWRFHHRLEAERRLDADEDLFRPGRFRLALDPGAKAMFVVSAEARPATGLGDSHREELRRRRTLPVGEPELPRWVHRLQLAAEAFLVQRVSDAGEPGRTIIAGYPWFGDWGRDTMIALPGLTLATGKASVAAEILRTFARYIDQGMLPNRFPDRGEPAEYNTVDAALWYLHALACYVDETNDVVLLRELFPALKEIMEWYERGTRFGIGADSSDGLLFAGMPGTQLTWMDAKVDEWVVTPRIGKPVEINALWHFALTQMTHWSELVGERQAAEKYRHSADAVARVFRDRFWYAEGGHLFDVIDTPEGGFDASLRPNQIFAVSLGRNLLTSPQARAVVDSCAHELFTPVGLRSLSQADARYAARYEGNPQTRDRAYHQGTVWSWLLGPFALAHYRAYGNPEHALELLAGIGPHLDQACLGSVSEIFDGSPPHHPRGCIAQAWSVGEVLRAWRALSRARITAPREASDAGP